MSLFPGSRLGPYEIQHRIGAGGMGEVYRARDTSLDRSVAIEVLPEAVARDPERLARFAREARTLAALNHQHIAQIDGFEQSASACALAMEFVDGEELAERIARGPVPWIEARDRDPDRRGARSRPPLASISATCVGQVGAMTIRLSLPRVSSAPVFTARAQRRDRVPKP